MSSTPKAVIRQNSSAIKMPVLRLGPRIILSEPFDDGGGLDLTGGGTPTVSNGSLQIIIGVTSTVLTFGPLRLVPGATYTVEIFVESNAGTITASIDSQTPISASSMTGLVRGKFVAASIIGSLILTVAGTISNIVEIGHVRCKI